MSTIEIRGVDVRHEAQLRAWWEVGAEATADRPTGSWPAWDVIRTTMPADNPNFDVLPLMTYADGEPAGNAQVMLPVRDNTHLAYADVLVPPRHRRRGVGTAMVEHLERLAKERARSVMLVETFLQPGEDEGAGSAFGLARGYAVANREEVKALDLRVWAPQWAALEAEVATHLGDHRVELWPVPMPEEHIVAFCDLLSVFLSMVPLGDLALEDAEWTPERVRANEARAAAVGRHVFLAGAFDPAGRLVGCSDVNLNRSDPKHAHIGITMVLPEARGHRLGLALKLANHRALMSAHPECELVLTTNANVNENMNSINERMGYRVREQLLEMQKEL